MVIINQVNPNIVTFSSGFKRGGMEVGARGTAIRLTNGDIFLFSPIKPDDSVFSALDKLGKVKYLVCPNIVHHMFVGDYKERYPEAQLFGVEGLEKKRTELKFDELISPESKTKKFGFNGEIDHHLFNGSRNKDVLFFHRPSETLLVADLIFNLPPTEQYTESEQASWGFLQRFLHNHFQPFTATHRFAASNLLVSDKQTTSNDVKYVLSNWNIKRIIPCHGNIIEDRAQEAF